MLAQARQRGASLVELMIGSLVSLLALTTAVTVYSATSRHASRQFLEADLRQQLYTLSDMLATELRRAGYRAFDPRLIPVPPNPFQQPGNTLRTGALDGQPEFSCVLYSYDVDSDGRVGTGRCPGATCPPLTDDDNVEQFGFRLNRGRVQSRYGGRIFSCRSGYWQTVTTPNLVVDTLNFALSVSCTNLAEREQPCRSGVASLEQRAIAFRLEAHIARHAEIRLGLSGRVQLRNDRLREPAP